MPIPIIIDTDPGIDDAAAISLALHHPQLDVQLISTVHGNVPLQRTTRNAQQLIEYFHAHVPVASGAASPLVQKALHAPHVHGESGMAGLDIARASNLPHALLPKIKEMNHTGNMLYHLFQHYRGESFLDGLNVYDAYTMMYLCYPELFTVRPAQVKVELSGNHARGATFVDFNVTDSSTHVLMDIQAEDFQTAFLEMLQYCP